MIEYDKSHSVFGTIPILLMLLVIPLIIGCMEIPTPEVTVKEVVVEVPESLACYAEAITEGIAIICPGKEPVVLPYAVNGKDGLDGQQGEAGANGDRGTDGINGNDGDPGTEGPQGLEGPSGANGEVGPQGELGEACKVTCLDKSNIEIACPKSTVHFKVTSCKITSLLTEEEISND